MILYKVKSPVLFILFNRPDTTMRVFEQIKQAQPSRLYVAVDGPRKGNTTDKYLCEQTRAIIKLVDWNCEVKTLFRDENLGCKEAPASAITWFFEQEEEGIILEDDCLPANDFFRFCDVLLEKYRYDTRIRHINGSNLQHGRIWGKADYYFAHGLQMWGWASWKRVWNEYDKDLKAYQIDDAREQFVKIFEEPLLAEAWINIFIAHKTSSLDTWDHQFLIINYFNNGLSINPNVNLISNIGYGIAATHTTNIGDIDSNVPLESIGEITHPQYVVRENGADAYTADINFGISKQKKEQRTIKVRFRNFRRNFKKKIKKNILNFFGVFYRSHNI